MRQFAFLFFCVFFFANCSTVKTASSGDAPAVSDKTVPVSAVTPEQVSLLKAVAPSVELNSKQKRYLDEPLPPEVREILEKSEQFEVLAEVRPEFDPVDEGKIFEPNRIVKVADENDKREILEAFYTDAAREDSPAACYLPHHGLRAAMGDKKVEIEICFSCSVFIVKSPAGRFEGTIHREDRRSEEVFKRLIQDKSVDLK